MSIHFAIGQKVVCINDKWLPAPATPITFPVEGQVYTIREFRECHCGCGRLFLLLHEIVNMPQPGEVLEPAFTVLHFKPVIEKKTETDISALRKLLVPSSRQLENA